MELIVAILIWYELGIIGMFLFSKLADCEDEFKAIDYFLIPISGIIIFSFGIAELLIYIFKTIKKVSKR